jgi:non-heme chloroperoxidase
VRRATLALCALLTVPAALPAASPTKSPAVAPAPASLRGAAQPLRFSTVEGGGGVPLNVVETGNPDGPAILFVHGMSQSYLAWLPQLRSPLAKTHRLVAFDLRGHGGSAKPWRPEDYADSKLWADDIAAVIAATGLERPVIVAWSYGGHAVLSYVRHYGTARVGALDFTGTLAGLKQVERQPGPDTEHLMAGSRLRASRDLEENIDGYRQMADGPTAKPLPPDLDRIAFLTGLLHPGYVRRAMRSLPTQNADLAPRLDVPVLLSMGRQDREWPIAACEQVAAMLPDARLSVYEDSGHFPSAEASERFNAELAALVQRRRR